MRPLIGFFILLFSSSLANAGDQQIFNQNDVQCFGDPFQTSANTNYCIANVGLWGTPAVAVGASWGHASVFFYVGSIKFRGQQRDYCELKIGNEQVRGNFVLAEQMRDYGRYTTQDGVVSEDDGTYCIFQNAEAKIIIDGIWAKRDVAIRLTSRKDDIIQFKASDWVINSLDVLYNKSEEYLVTKPVLNIKDPTKLSVVDKFRALTGID